MQMLLVLVARLFCVNLALLGDPAPDLLQGSSRRPGCEGLMIVSQRAGTRTVVWVVFCPFRGPSVGEEVASLVTAADLGAACSPVSHAPGEA